MNRFGSELKNKPGLRAAQKIYTSFFGNPSPSEFIKGTSFIRFVESQKMNLNDHKILDAGTGWGPYAYWIAKKFPKAKITAYDLHEKTAQKNRSIAQAEKLSNIDFRSQSLEDMNEKDKYSFILCVDVLEHIKHDEKVIQNLYEALQENGTVYIHVPNEYHRFLFSRKRVITYKDHFRSGYSRTQLIDLLQKHGFTVKKSGYTFGIISILVINFFLKIFRARIFLYLFMPILKKLLYFDTVLHKKDGNGVWVVAQK